MLGDWGETDTDCPECGSSDTAKNTMTDSIWCKECEMEYVIKYG